MVIESQVYRRTVRGWIPQQQEYRQVDYFQGQLRIISHLAKITLTVPDVYPGIESVIVDRDENRLFS